ncbi:hypothetical protein KRMM14A1004_59950 [Krasilnikovia sp. MM14-A1004]
MVLTGRIEIHAGLVYVLDRHPPVDALAHTVLDHLAGEQRPLPVRTWLAFLARFAYIEVADRMRRAGHVREHVARRLFGRTVRYVPTDMNTAAWPWARLSSQLSRGRPLDVFDVALGGLVLATDLHRMVLSGRSAEVSAQLRGALVAAPPPVRELVEYTESAVGAAVTIAAT